MMDDLAKVKCVHRFLLKTVTGRPAPNDTFAPSTSAANLPARQEALSDEDNLLALVKDTSLPPADCGAGGG